MGDLDKDFLQHVGGVENNSFILHADTDDDDNGDQPEIISHSPYYDTVNLISIKNNLSIRSTYIQSVSAKFDELNIFIEHLRTLKLEFSAICTHRNVVYQIMMTYSKLN